MMKIQNNGINFVKMQALGNDFVIVEDSEIKKWKHTQNPDQLKFWSISNLAKKICDRHFGIGGDGLILVNPISSLQNVDTTWKIFNSDGSEAEMCGNGMRCFAKYVYDNNLISDDLKQKKKFSVGTKAGIISPSICENGLVKVDMGKPILNPEKIPVSKSFSLGKQQILNEALMIFGREFKINCVSMGNPHCVIFLNSDPETDKINSDFNLEERKDEQEDKIAKFGAEIEKHPMFPAKTNVEFVKILNKNHILVQVWERGCGKTMACGTGACACVFAGFCNGYLEKSVKVTFPGGDLLIDIEENEEILNCNCHIFKTGPAEYVFKGSFYL